MKNNDWKKREGVVYSTDENYSYAHGNAAEEETLPPSKQQLRVELDKSGRAGKQVTVISGFVGTHADRETLCKALKSKCGVGGSVKDLDILIQGDLRQKAGDFLVASGYRVRRI